MSAIRFVEVSACVHDHYDGIVASGVKASEANSFGVYLRRGTPDEHYADWVADCIDQPTATILAEGLQRHHGVHNPIIFNIQPETDDG